MQSFRLIISFTLLSVALCQFDGNPHNWDRRRRCDRFDYDPPCGVCEGYGGIAYGDENDEITLTTCKPVASAEEIDPASLKRPVWGEQWTLPEAREILIGPKNDPFCFVVFPGADSIGDLCYVKQQGQKWYDMKETRAFKEQLDVETPLGTTQSTVLHQGPNMWIVNRYPWWAGGLDQCVCVAIREGGDVTKTTPIYPVNDLWVNNLEYIGREIVGVEYLKDDGLTEVELDHWAFGPHHAWTYPENGRILRMWQPFNGLQIYPGNSVDPGYVDLNEFATIPPTECKRGRGSAWFRTGCEDDGFPTLPEDEVKRAKFAHKTVTKVVEKDIQRAKTKVPRHDYRGMGFTDMSMVLNQWINSSYDAVPCEMWKVEEIQQLQALLWLARESSFDDIYQATQDNRRLRDNILQDIQKTWSDLNAVAANSEDPSLTTIRRDGHCHEAVMWFVHHLTEDMKNLLRGAEIKIPMLSHYRHDCDDIDPLSDRGQVCRSYKTQVTCADCHSDL